jgi:putative spermidine/putrescine transport system ATP-binding protein
MTSTTPSRDPGSFEVSVEQADHRYDEHQTLDGLDLRIRPGEFLTILGPSGCGKTTLLRSVAGLVSLDSGSVRVGGVDVTHLPPQRRDMGYVFQNYALFPHLTVADNVRFGLQFRKVSRLEAQDRVASALRLVEMTDFAQRFPATLSGGQQQRVAIARAVVINPRVLLLDEPLGALDRRLRQHLSLELRRIQRETKLTTMYVTHDQEEAFSVSDRIAIMFGGRIRQIDEPRALYDAPNDIVVARFLGEINTLPGRVVRRHGPQVVVQALGEQLSANVSGRTIGERVICGVRPEHVVVGLDAMHCQIGSAVVDDVIFQGSASLCALTWRGTRLLAQVAASNPAMVGEEIAFGWHADHLLAFDDDLTDDAEWSASLIDDPL